METKCAPCTYEPLFSVQIAGLQEDLHELKTRVQVLETTLTRGILMLVANLAAVLASLVHELI